MVKFEKENARAVVMGAETIVPANAKRATVNRVVVAVVVNASLDANLRLVIVVQSDKEKL